MGEFFGSHEGLGQATMHAYIDQEDFSGLTIHVALRQLLSSFRLPGTVPSFCSIDAPVCRCYACCVTTSVTLASAQWEPSACAFMTQHTDEIACKCDCRRRLAG